ncbi:ribonuclease Z, partial [Candidatus Micrarchaeota archaeon]|nr:ribonuclease Z [Candidatus Micrarchaeota archaeon]
DVSNVKKGKKIVYSGDTTYCESIVKASKEADLLIHEATFDNELKHEAEEKKHSTVSDAATTAKKAKAKKLILTHISNRYKADDLLLSQARKIFKNTEIAFDGLEILL